MTSVNSNTDSINKWKASLLIFAAGWMLQGCFLSGPGSAKLKDPCEDARNRFVTQHGDGTGVTSEECRESEHGEWIDGRCYCHGGE